MIDQIDKFITETELKIADNTERERLYDKKPHDITERTLLKYQNTLKRDYLHKQIENRFHFIVIGKLKTVRKRII